MEVNNSYTCQDCGLNLPKIQDYILHLMWEHDPQAWLQRRQQQQQLPLAEEQPPVQEQPQEVQENIDGNIQVAEENDDPQQCTLCEAIIKRNDMLRHMRRFHMPWTAPICEDLSNVNNPLKSHKPKQCKECGLFFLYDRNLAMHLHEHGLSPRDINAAVKVCISYTIDVCLYI